MKMSPFSALLMLAIVTTPGLCDKFTILRLATSDCPGEFTGEVCLTLEQYVNNPSQSSEITLLLQPGLHSLPANFMVSSSTHNFSMTSAGATIVCDRRSRLLTWASVENINITGISFKDCGGFLIDRAVTVHFTDIAITNSGPTQEDLGCNHDCSYTLQIRYTIGPYVPDPVSSAVLRNVTFQNNFRQSFIWLMYTVIFEHVNCINSSNLRVQARDGQTVTQGGGLGTFHYGPQTAFIMTQSLFSHNTGFRGLELYVNKGYISNSTFVDNLVGLYVQDMNLTVENTVFSRNSGRGALSGSGTNLTMTNCTFSSNTDSALFTERPNFLTLQDSTFVNNKAKSTGGGIYFSGNNMIVTSCTFDSNTATIKGGAIYAPAGYISTIRSSLNVFINNSAASGGALSMEHTGLHVALYSTDDVFRGNNASVSGGAIYSIMNGFSATLSVRNSTFCNNIAVDEQGGAVFLMGVNIGSSFVESTFDSNSAADLQGGAIFSDGVNSTLSFVENTFDLNSARSCGVVDARNHIAVHFNSCSFTNNVARGEVIGGGVTCIRNASVSIRNTTFTYNRANLHAGVLYIDNSSVSILKSTFLGNSAAANGGVIYTRVVSAEYSISHSAFSYNSAGDSGGVMYLNSEGSQVTMTESIISFNSAADRGGAFSVISASLNITRSNIYNNTANIGSAISACSSAVYVEELNSSVDSAHPTCDLYEGFVNTFNIDPPHDFNTLVTTSIPPTSNPPITSSLLQTSNSVPTSSPPVTHSPLQTSDSVPTSIPPSTSTSSSPTTTYCSELGAQTTQDQIKRLTILVYIFATIIIVLVLCVIALSTKVIYDCMQARAPERRQSLSFSLGAVDDHDSKQAATSVRYQTVSQEES